MPLLDSPHLLMLVITAVGIAVVTRLGKRNRGGIAITLLLVGVLLGSSIGFTLSALQEGTWSYRWALPLHLCDLATICVVVTLLYPISLIGELSYVWAIAGSLPALLTPNLSAPFPEPTYLVFFAMHGGVIVSVFYLIASRKIVITWNSLWRVWLVTHLYAGLIALFNAIFQTNYLFLCWKPSQFSPLDYMGPWPLYLGGLEIWFVISLFLSYVIYQLMCPRRRRC